MSELYVSTDIQLKYILHPLDNIDLWSLSVTLTFMIMVNNCDKLFPNPFINLWVMDWTQSVGQMDKALF